MSRHLCTLFDTFFHLWIFSNTKTNHFQTLTDIPCHTRTPLYPLEMDMSRNFYTFFDTSSYLWIFSNTKINHLGHFETYLATPRHLYTRMRWTCRDTSVRSLIHLHSSGYFQTIRLISSRDLPADIPCHTEASLHPPGDGNVERTSVHVCEVARDTTGQITMNISRNQMLTAKI